MNKNSEDLDYIIQLSFYKLQRAPLLPFVLIRNALLSSQSSIHAADKNTFNDDAHKEFMEDEEDDVTMLHDDSDEETWLQACFDEADEDDEDEDNIMDDFGDEMLESALRRALPIPKPQSPEEEIVSFMDTDDNEQQTIPYDHQQVIP